MAVASKACLRQLQIEIHHYQIGFKKTHSGVFKKNGIKYGFPLRKSTNLLYKLNCAAFYPPLKHYKVKM